MDNNIKTVRLLSIGNSGVGKTAVSKCYVTGQGIDPESGNMATIGVDYWHRKVTFKSYDGEHTANVQIWDTAGQEKFRDITTAYYRSGDAIFVMYDISCQASFDDITMWLQKIRENTTKTVPIALIGNKTDLENAGKRCISREQGQALADENDLLFFETSAVTNSDVSLALDTLIKKAYETIPDDKCNEVVIIRNDHHGEKKKRKEGCCK